MQTVAT